MCKINKNVPVEKFGDISNCIEKVLWQGNIKPAIYNVEATITDSVRYEEIQFFQVHIHSREDIYEIGKVIFSDIKYPCVVEFISGNEIIIGVCKFNLGKVDYSSNVHKRIFFSHILRKEILSSNAQNMIDEINESIKKYKSIGDIYDGICQSVMNYKLSGTSREHVDRLIVDMLGKVSGKEKELIRQYCKPYKYHKLIPGEQKYGGKRFKNYTLVHDYEEIWYCFMKYPAIKNIIEKRRYRDIYDLIYSIDSKEQ